MSEEKKPLLSDLTQDLGIGATATAAITALWAGGWWQWIPAVLVICVGVYTLGLKKVLPWQTTLNKDLAQLNEGKGSHRRLAKTLRSTVDGMFWGSRQHLDGRQATLDADGSAGRWHQSMVYANQRLDRWLGLKIWTFRAFSFNLMIASIYPLLFFITIWLFTGSSHIGKANAIPSMDLFFRLLVILMIVWPLLISWIFKLPHTRHSILFWTGFVLMYTPILAVFFASGELKESLLFSLPLMLALIGTTASSTASTIAGMSAGIGLITVLSPSPASVVLCIMLLSSALVIGKIRPLNKDQPTPQSHKYQPSRRLTWIVLLSFFLTAIISTVFQKVAPNVISALELSTLAALLFGLGWMPTINALLDWLSLGITRELLRRMTRSPGWMWGGMLLDVIAGMVLTLGLLWLTFQILAFMQWSGWPVDAQAMRATFIANPLDPQVSWLAMLALTNLLPTIWHLGVSLWGLVDRQFTTPESLKESLIKLNDFMDDKGNPRPGVAAPGLGELDLQAVYHSLFVHPWLYVGTVVALVAGLWGSYVQVLRWTLTWLP